MISAPKASSGPRWGRVLAAILGIAGLPMAVIGGWLFLGARNAAEACSHRAVAVCLQGFVVLNATQLVGGGIALAGIVLVFTAIYMALR
jgi:hypothetical protein